MRIAMTAAALCLAALAVPAHAQQRYWYDGDQRRPLWSDDAWIADFSVPSAEKSRLIKPAALGKPGATDQSPVFRDASDPASPRRALPGGVIVRFTESTTAGQRDALIAKHRLDPVRVIGGSGATWLMRSAPGIASLELANRLYESGEFEAASPNWWRPRALK